MLLKTFPPFLPPSETGSVSQSAILPRMTVRGRPAQEPLVSECLASAHQQKEEASANEHGFHLLPLPQTLYPRQTHNQLHEERFLLPKRSVELFGKKSPF